MTTGLTKFERVEIQMEAVVPLIRRLQRELGDDVVLAALRRQLDERIDEARVARAAKGKQADMSRVAPGMEAWATGGALEYEVLENDDDRVDLDVSYCRYSELMDRLGARDLGEILVCGDDYVGAAAVGMDLDRVHTHMTGDGFCDFRFTKVEITGKA